ncbi:MAG: ABC transporter ATP-binding protein [Burkholderiales bacterium]|jgi:branched-chain amino acid transport system ATP-binding protein|nr:ABC transporter ATP-binding protein [Burkholderiales bacterium]
MAEPLLRVDGLTKRFGGLTASDAISLDVLDGELHAVIGPNGAGKTTFIAQLMGELKPDAGSIRFGGVDITRMSTPDRVHRGIGRTFQIVQLLPEATALANVAIAVQVRQGHSFRFLAPVARDRTLMEPSQALLSRVGLSARADIPVAALSHGERKQLELAVALAGEPRLLLLDEPMAGLGPVESRRMLELLAELKGHVAMLLVEHDMETVFALADRISVLVYGRIIASGTAAQIQADPEVRSAYLGEGDA